MNLSDLDVKRALLVGDTHGSLWAWEQEILPTFQDAGCDVIVQLGDFGYGWDDRYCRILDDLIHDFIYPAPVFWLDGNHENFDRLEDIGAFPNQTEPQGTGIYQWYLPRGYRWTWNGVNLMAVGGAYSVDKPYRTEHVDWWRQEELTEADVFRAATAGPVDVMLAHDALDGIQIPGLPGPDDPDPYRSLCAPNRERLRAIFNSVWPSVYVHGHFHIPYWDIDTFPHTIVVGLNADGRSGSIAVLDVSTGRPEVSKP